MKQVEHKILSVSALIVAMTVLFLSLTNPIKAGAESYSTDNRKEISVDKQLRSVHDDKYVDNISSSVRVFHQEDLIEFKIIVENIGNGVLKNIKVTDTLPPFLKLVFFPGTYNKTDNKVEWTIDQLDAGHSQEFLIRAKIDQAQNVVALTKETNVTEVRVDELGDKDNASYYIGGGVSIPNTGSASLPIKTGIIITLGLAGFLVRKKVRGY